MVNINFDVEPMRIEKPIQREKKDTTPTVEKINSPPTVVVDEENWWVVNEFYERGETPRCTREHWIAALVKEHGWTIGAELGLFKGRTFLFVLQQCPELTLIGVDLWDEQPDNTGPETYVGGDFPQHEKRVRDGAEQFGDRAIIIKDWTSEAAKQVEDGSLDFVFIDADHSEEAVRNDIITWMPKVKDSGWILGHDINWITVRAIVDELLPDYDIGPDNTWGRPKVIDNNWTLRSRDRGIKDEDEKS